MGCWGPRTDISPFLVHVICRDKDGRFSLNDILDMLELGRARARLHQVQTLHTPAWYVSAHAQCAARKRHVAWSRTKDGGGRSHRSLRNDNVILLHQAHEFGAQLAGYCTLQLWRFMTAEGGRARFVDWCVQS